MSTSSDTNSGVPSSRTLSAADIELLRRRAVRYARRVSDDHFTTEEVIVFSRGGGSYAAELRSLREIRPLYRLTRIPGAARAVPGIFHYRGEILSAHDLHALKGGAAGRAGAEPAKSTPQWVLIAEHNNTRVGLLADEIEGVKEVPSQDVRPVPLTLGELGAGFTGVIGGAVLVLNLPALFALPAFMSAY